MDITWEVEPFTADLTSTITVFECESTYPLRDHDTSGQYCSLWYIAYI